MYTTAILSVISAAFVIVPHPSNSVPSVSLLRTKAKSFVNGVVGRTAPKGASETFNFPAIFAGELIVSGFMSAVAGGFHKYIAIRGALPSAGVAKVALFITPILIPVCAKATTLSFPVAPLP